MRFRMILVGLLLAAAVVFVAGCGGGDGSGSTSASDSTSASTEAEGTGETTGKEEGPAVNEEAAAGGKEEGESGEEGGKEETPSAEKTTFIQEGDKVCSEVPTRYAKKLSALEKANGGKKLPVAEANLKAAVPPLYTAVEEFEALTPPSGSEAEVEAIIAALEAAAHGIEEKPKSELTGPKSPFAEFISLTTKYGFQICSQL